MKKNNVIAMPLRKSVLWRDMIMLYIATWGIMSLVQILGRRTDDRTLQEFISLSANIIWYMLLRLIVTKIERRSMRPFSIPQKRIGQQLLFGIGLGIIIAFLFNILPLLVQGKLLGINHFPSKTARGEAFYMFFFHFFVSAPVEERIYRGYYQSRLKEATDSDFLSVILTTILFVLPHLLSREFSWNFIDITLVGLILSIVRWKCRNASMLVLGLAHAIDNFSLTLLSLYAIIV